MKKYYTAVFILVDFILAIFLSGTLRSKKETAKPLSLTITFGIIAVTSQIFVTATWNRLISSIAYSIFYACINWMLLWLLKFSYLYTRKNENTQSIAKAIQVVLMTIVSMDSIMLLSNHFTHFAFAVYPMRDSIYSLYFMTHKFLYFTFHLGLAYILAGTSFLLLIIRIIKTPPVYWSKYIFILAGLAVTIIWDGLFVVNKDYVDFSIIGYAISAMIISYFALLYKPRSLVDRMLAHIEEINDDMLLFFDLEGNCIFANATSRKFFSAVPSSEYHTILYDWLRETGYKDENRDYTANVSTIWKNKPIHLRINYRTLQNKKKDEGYFFYMHDTTEEVEAYNQAMFKATHDELTGIYNKENFCLKVEEQRKNVRDGETWYIFVTDIKEFKLINDLFGRSIGDAILKKTAELIAASVPKGASYGRIGLDRFVVYCNDFEAFRKALINKQWQLSILTGGSNFPIIVHGGIYRVLSSDTITVNTMIDRAYIAVSTIKSNYEPSVAFYDNSMRNNLLWESEIIGELEAALKNKQFEMYLQPQANREAKVYGAEALIRWNHPTRGVLNPASFIQVFEKNGLIAQIDRFIWEEACKTLAEWKEKGKSDYYISVNISPRDFYYIDIYDTFSSMVDHYNIDAKNLKLEITETVMITDVERKISLIERLKKAGFIVEMDDFGSGYSSLNMLKDIPVDILKIDMMFLYRAKDTERSKKIVTQIIALAKALEIGVVTEGVENKEQFEFLRNSGSDIFQGYYFSKPIRLKDFEEQYMQSEEQ